MTHQLPTLAELHHDPPTAFKNDQLNLLLSQQPHESWLKPHPIVKTKNAQGQMVPLKYMPVDKVEFLLVRIFGGYEVEVRSVQQIFNSICVTVRLRVKHPVTGQDWCQDGIGAVAAQTDGGASAADLGAIKANAIQIGAPAAESYAIKDAAEKYGAVFGKDLNKVNIIPFQGAYNQAANTINTSF
jgi:hypothetical protein